MNSVFDEINSNKWGQIQLEENIPDSLQRRIQKRSKMICPLEAQKATQQNCWRGWGRAADKDNV